MENLSPEQTQTLRTAQKKRGRVILVILLVWIVGLFALTIVKGHQAEQQRAQTQGHD